MKRQFLLLLTLILITTSTIYSASGGSINFNVEISSTDPVFSMYKAENSNGSITGVSPLSEATEQTLESGALLENNDLNATLLKYYFFFGSNYNSNPPKGLSVTLNSAGFAHSDPNITTAPTVPIKVNVTIPKNGSRETETITNQTLSSSNTTVLSNYSVPNGYFLDKYSTQANAPIPPVDTYNGLRAPTQTYANKELFFMELAIGWEGNDRLPAGSYKATIQIGYEAL